MSETNRLGNETSYDYDNLGRLLKKTDAEGGETEYTYDANGNRLTLTDPEENTTTWTYDYLNRMLTNTNELSDTRTYEYDAAGNLVEYTDRNGRVIEYEYDNLQRRTAENWMDGATTVHTFSYSYDAASQLIEASDSAATYTFTYDNLGRNTSTEHDLAALGFDVVIDEAYDALGRRVSLTAEIDGTDDLENTYAYDYLNRMTQVTQAGQSGGNAVAEKRVDFTYDAEDKYQFTSITRYADLAGTETVATSTYGYDYADQLTSITHVDGGSSTLAGYTYSYDEGNRLTGFTVYGYSAEDATYSYDDTDQLTGADRSGTTSDESYTYDENGNRTGGGYSTGDNNQVLSDGTYNYTYDDEGNRLTKTNISTGAYEAYSWDHRNRLASVTAYDASDVKQWKVDYGYDAFNNLVSREVDSNGDGMVDASGYFVYNGNQIMLVVDDAGDVEHRMLWGPQVDQLLADEDGAGDVLWALNDNQNTVRDYVEYDDLLDDSTVVNHIAYDAVGQIDSETSGALDTFRFRYTGKYVDLLTGLQYNLNRWYDPAAARWMSEDPISFAAGDENLYRYVGNGYLNAVDPSGLLIQAIAVEVAAGIEAAGTYITFFDKLTAKSPSEYRSGTGWFSVGMAATNVMSDAFEIASIQPQNSKYSDYYKYGPSNWGEPLSIDKIIAKGEVRIFEDDAFLNFNDEISQYQETKTVYDRSLAGTKDAPGPLYLDDYMSVKFGTKYRLLLSGGYWTTSVQVEWANSPGGTSISVGDCDRTVEIWAEVTLSINVLYTHGSRTSRNWIPPRQDWTGWFELHTAEDFIGSFRHI
ncbi:RHS repeat-associated core domain-containing protein [Blastopirellula marina]|uniref:RHS repeat-associated core domain-containing protein n=1 Tax=Blastopirellula marina TaxID=124 RepID=UPI0013049958|nr:RHS repeat-associated core domain-containing protein [Blastopirellula marina]